MRIRQISLLLMLLLCSAVVNAAPIPAGTRITVRLGSTINSGTAEAGETWKGTVAKDVVVRGQTVANNGDAVTGKITMTKSSGRLRAPGQLVLRLTSVNRQPVSSSAYYRKANARARKNGATSSRSFLQGQSKQLGALANAGSGAPATEQEAVIPAGTLISFTIVK